MSYRNLFCSITQLVQVVSLARRTIMFVRRLQPPPEAN
jgi:hypothetical protein